MTASLGLRGPLAKKRTAGACRSVESGGLTTLPPDHCYQKPAGASSLAILVPSSAILDGGVPDWLIQVTLIIIILLVHCKGEHLAGSASNLGEAHNIHGAY